MAQRTCSADGCERAQVKAQGLCAKHYHRLRRHGDPLGGDRERIYRAGQPCGVDGCQNPSHTRGFCPKHYKRVWQHGDPMLGARQCVALSDKGYRLLWRPNHPSAQKSGYVLEHRLVMEQQIGRRLEPWETPHHKNGIRTDNRPENLELWVKPQPSGQRVEDLVAFVVEHYPAEVEAALADRPLLASPSP